MRAFYATMIIYRLIDADDVIMPYAITPPPRVDADMRHAIIYWMSFTLIWWCRAAPTMPSWLSRCARATPPPFIIRRAACAPYATDWWRRQYRFCRRLSRWRRDKYGRCFAAAITVTFFFAFLRRHAVDRCHFWWFSFSRHAIWEMVMRQDFRLFIDMIFRLSPDYFRRPH